MSKGIRVVDLSTKLPTTVMGGEQLTAQSIDAGEFVNEAPFYCETKCMVFRDAPQAGSACNPCCQLSGHNDAFHRPPKTTAMKTENIFALLTPIFVSLEKELREEGKWPPPKGWSPSSPEWATLFEEPFISFQLNPLPSSVQCFVNDMPGDEWGERDAVSDLLERLYVIPPGFIVVPMGGDQFDVVKQLKADCQ